MRAAVIHAPHDLRVEETPSSRRANDVKVRIGAGGICGSDLHYYHHALRDRAHPEPMILGHEIAGTSSPPERTSPGSRKATTSPSIPACLRCVPLLPGRSVQPLPDMRFYGSAMRNPHVQGGFREELVCTQAQAIKLPPPPRSPRPLSPNVVRLPPRCSSGRTASRQASPGHRHGPIGALLIMVARQAGARNRDHRSARPATRPGRRSGPTAPSIPVPIRPPWTPTPLQRHLRRGV